MREGWFYNFLKICKFNNKLWISDWANLLSVLSTSCWLQLDSQEPHLPAPRSSLVTPSRNINIDPVHCPSEILFVTGDSAYQVNDKT